MKRSLVAGISVCLLAAFVCGCHTVGGAAKGASEGAKKDYQEMKKADAWLQENLW